MLFNIVSPVNRVLLPVVLGGVSLFCLGANAEPVDRQARAEWPQYRADAERSGFVNDTFSETATLEWIYQPRQAPVRAWLGEDTRMSFDQPHHPLVVSGGMVFFGSSADCSIVALDAETAAERWRYVTDAPVRFAPAAWEGQVFATSDDGSLYVLEAATGRLIRRVDPAPRKDMVLGNRRMVSRWPARGGPVVRDGIVYFGAGIWPSEGVILSALDARTGELIWRNDESGGLEWDQPHGGARAESGIASQGYLVATPEHLLVPTGRGVPAAFDRRTGEMKYFHLQKYGRPTGGATIVAAGEFFFNGGHFFTEATGLSAGAITGRDLIVALPDMAVYSDGRQVHAVGWSDKAAVDRRGKVASVRRFQPLPLGASGADRSVAGALGEALQLDDAPAHVALDAPWAGQPNTFAAWVRLRRDLPNQQRIGIVAGNFPDDASVNWEVQTGGRPRLHWNRGQVDWTVDVDLRTGEWLHYAFVRDAKQDRVFFYLDGKLVATREGAGDDVSPQTASYIGGDKRGPSSPWFSGAIDDVRVYNRPLSAEEIALVSHRDATGQMPSEGLVFHLPMDEQPATPGSRLSDASSIGNHGRLLGPSSQNAPHEVHGMIAVGNTLVLGGPNVVTALDLQATSPDRVIVWRAAVEGVAGGLAWAAGRLYVSTDRGAIYCFGPGNGGKPRTATPELAAQPWPDNGQYAMAAKEIVRLGDVRDGYALDLGCGEGRLAYELAMRTNLHVIAVDSDPNAVAAAREKLIAAGLYGTRVTVHQGDPAGTIYPNYFADLVVSARSLSDGPEVMGEDEMMRVLRPWGGVAVVGKLQAMRRVERGELPGSGTWTHQYCNAGATLTSTDQLVRRPLGMLWFTDFENVRMPDRHGRGPAPLFAGGRLFVLGKHGLYAISAYNGRLLWEHPIENVLKPYDQEHITGAAVTGSAYCHGQGSVYVRHEDYALRIDEATGKALARFPTPAAPGAKPGTWGFIATDDGVLFGSVANDDHLTMWAWHSADMQDMPSESSELFALDAVTGEHLWTYKAAHSIRHNTIVIGGGRVYLIDRPVAQDDLLARQTRRLDNPHRLLLAGESAGHAYGVLVALDARTGEVLWKAGDEVFGTMLALSLEHDVLVMTYQRNHAYFLRSEVGGRMAGYRASTGQRIWSVEAEHKSRIMLNAETVYAQVGAWNLLTGEPVPFTLARSYGCGTLAASSRMMLFRSGTLGYRDLSTERTENYGGIRPGCWINAIPAGGLVLMPDATHGCTCSYLNKAYVALQPME